MAIIARLMNSTDPINYFSFQSFIATICFIIVIIAIIIALNAEKFFFGPEGCPRNRIDDSDTPQYRGLSWFDANPPANPNFLLRDDQE